MYRDLYKVVVLTTVVMTLFSARPLFAQSAFVHPGGLQSMADLNRIKAKVAAFAIALNAQLADSGKADHLPARANLAIGYA